jgi:HK97 family phage prohead protease
MPYYITRESQECAGYAVVSVYEDQTELHGCHLTRQAAIDQMVAMSEEEGIEPGGDLDQIEETIEEDMAKPAPVVQLAAPVTIISFSGNNVTLEAAAEGKPSRTISGIAVPYGETATVSDGTQVRFMPGSLPVEGKAPKLFMYHDASQPVGLVTSRVETDQGMLFQAKISNTAAGNDALELAKDGVIDAVSVGVNPTEYDMDGDVMVVRAADWMELSLVPIPAFSGATITDVAAAAKLPDTTKTTPQKEAEVEASPVEAAVEAAIPTAPIPAQPKREFRMPSAGDYLAAMHIGGDTFAKINAAYHDAVKASRSTIEAAAGDVITTDTPGLLPVPVLGPLVQDINFIRPVVQAVGARAYPDGGAQKTFIRPTITTHTSAASQANELAAVSATTMVIASNSVSKTTVAGQVTLSVQDIDFTSPAAMNLILNDLMGEYMLATDNIAADNLLTAANASGTWDLTAADLVKSIYDAAADISNGRNWFPTHMFVSPDVWAQLGQVVDSTNAPLFPFIGAGLTGQNRLGSQNATSWNGNPLGLELVVDSNFAAKTMIITRVGTGQGDAYEFYEQIKGLMSVEIPSTLGRTFSYHGYVSTFAAIGGMIRKIVQA